MQFIYTNHRGETEPRKVTPIALLRLADPGAISGHLASYNPGFFLECITHDRNNELRHFALDHIGKFVFDDDPDGEDLRLPLASGIGQIWATPYGLEFDRQEYFDGFERGVGNGLFDLEKAADLTHGAIWAHGYNDGRRYNLEHPFVTPEQTADGVAYIDGETGDEIDGTESSD